MSIGKYLVFCLVAASTATSALAQGVGGSAAKMIEKSVTASKLLQQNSSAAFLRETYLFAS